MSKFRRFLVLSTLIWGLLSGHSLKSETSTSQNLSDLQSSFEKLRDTFLQELSSIPDHPDKLENGTLATDVETLCEKDLKNLLDQVDNQREILKERENELDTKQLSDSDKEELRQALKSQKKPLDALQKKITNFRGAMDELKSSGIQSMKSSYDEFLSIKGQQAAAEKLRLKIDAIEEPYKPTPTPVPTPIPTPSPTPYTQPASQNGIQWSVANQSATPVTRKQNRGYYRVPNESSGKILSFDDALQRADQGDAYYQAVVSIYYSLGYMTQKNQELAAKYAVLSAKQKHPLGIYRLGVLRQEGEGGIQQNESEGLALKEAAFEGLNNTMMGDPYAITALGIMCFRGEGVKKNLEQAAQLYKKAADMGYAPAQYTYSVCLISGQGVARNPYSARAYWQLAYNQGYGPALKGMPKP
jgi:hypothetical protein